MTVLVPAALLSTLLFLPSLPQLFHKSKEQFQLGAYAESLKTLEELDSESQKPGLERDRAALLPGLLFYRGASLAALGWSAEASQAFEEFLVLEPNAQLDPGRYPRSVLAAVESARKALEQKRGKPSQQGNLAAAYAAFPAPQLAEIDGADPNWAEGPVRALLTSLERRDFESRADSVSRSEFISTFWKMRDPHPEKSRNEFREEFLRRVAFADAHFSQDEVRGGLTDRGVVFILLGPPSYSGRKPLQTGDDAADSSGLSQYSRAQVASASRPGGSSTDRMARIAKVTGPGAKIQDAASNWIEVWHYLNRDLPRELPYPELEFQFVTKVGYGKSVLQRDSKPLAALERARSVARTGKIARAPSP